MTDLSAQFANRFESNMAEQNQPNTDMVNARLERIEELERVRQERLANHNSSNNNEPPSRMQRRERLIRQTTQTRSMERRSFASNIQRTPVVRSQTLDTNPANEDNLSFRELFESTRQNLFPQRVSASSDNLSTFHRSSSDTRLLRTPSTVPQETDSGSSTPRSISRPRWDLASGLAEAFSSVRSSLIRPETSMSAVDVSTRTPATIRETRNTSTNMQRFVMSSQNESPLSRSASVRESRRETRFRRRTIDSVDSNVTRALERERVDRAERTERRERNSSATRASSVTRTTSFNRTQTARSQYRQTSQESDTKAEVTVTESATESQQPSSYSSYTPYRRVVDIFPDDSLPVLGLEEEKMKFIDSEGHCHWLSKHHQLLRIIKNTNNVPDIKKVKLQTNDQSEPDGYIAAMEDEEEARYKKLRELVHIARKQDETVAMGEDVESEQRLSLLELYERGDFLDDKQNEDENIDEKYKSVSLYTPPRSRPDLEEYLQTRVVVPLYDGIEKPSEESEKKEPKVVLVPRGPVSYQLSASRISGGQFVQSTSMANGGTSIVSQRIAQARQHSLAVSQSANGNSMSYRANEQSAFAQEVTEFDVPDTVSDNNFNDMAENSEVNLVMERLHVMQAASGQEMDASHLDYDEMLMIQQALLDNPSPPETPEQMSPGQFLEEEPYESYEHFEDNSAPAPLVHQPPPALSRINSSPSKFNTSRTPGRSTVTQQVNQTEARSFLRSHSSEHNRRTEQTSSSARLSQSMSSIRSSGSTVQRETVQAHSEVFSETSTTEKNVSNSGSDTSTDSNTNNQGPGTSESRDSIQNRPYPNRVSMSPRLQRISSSGSDTMLPMPSMDFSPLSKSPQRSSQRFSFNEGNTSSTIPEVTNSNTSDTNTASTSNESSAQNTLPSTSSSTNVQEQLTIEIPESNDTVAPLRPSTSSGHDESQGQRSSTSPVVKSRPPSTASNEAVSPAGSDIVTTVFEEFVQTIPRDLLNTWSSSQVDER